MKKLGLMTALLSLSLFAFGQDNETSTDKWDLRECVEYALENNLTVNVSFNG